MLKMRADNETRARCHARGNLLGTKCFLGAEDIELLSVIGSSDVVLPQLAEVMHRSMIEAESQDLTASPGHSPSANGAAVGE